MGLYWGQPTRLKSSNSVQHFANLTPKKSGGGFGWLGFARILGAILEIGLSVIFPAIAPAFVIGGGVFQQALDTYSFGSNRIDRRSVISFGLNTLINVLPVGLALRNLRASKNVLRIVDNRAKKGFRYVVRGSSVKDAKYFDELDKGIKAFSNSRVSTIPRFQVQNLANKGVVPSTRVIKKLKKFETALQETFSKQVGRQASGDIKYLTNYVNGGIDGYGLAEKSKKYILESGNQVFSNRDLSILRSSITDYARGLNGLDTIGDLRNLLGKRLSSQSRNVLGFDKLYKGTKFSYISKSANKRLFQDNVLNLTSTYLAEATKQPIKRGFFGKLFHLAGGKKGQAVTQLGQLPNPNDFAREILNRPTSLLLNGRLDLFGKEVSILGKGGLRGWARGVRKSIDDKFPKIKLILDLPIAKRLVKKYNTFKQAITEKGVLTKDDTFLMGWRVEKKGASYSDVTFYFNPIRTSARTRGSINFGGKAPIHTTIKNTHLKHLALTLTPGHAYLKGEGGFPPLAMSAGGKRAFNFAIQNEALQLLSVYLPLGGIRNILSLVSNAKSIVKQVAEGTFAARWKSTFVNTFKRLWVNKVTRVLGHTAGNIIGQETGAHVSRILKTVGQGFTKTTSKTRYVNGVKIIDRSTTFSFKNSFNSRYLVSQGIPNTMRSRTLRASPKRNVAREKLKLQRYGRNLRRPFGIVGIT